ncbi:hypothetical protein [uncultured Mucilaginibacter sp.]|uniref:hypothetical protein n=1 Tax=uncultured Mucilaginibacter sp. TaxID=797541 RepID=UPI0025FFC38D|nr:hypothetical protein [uncultured Mucilaginibacter sp.]
MDDKTYKVYRVWNVTEQRYIEIWDIDLAVYQWDEFEQVEKALQNYVKKNFIVDCSKKFVIHTIQITETVVDSNGFKM